MRHFRILPAMVLGLCMGILQTGCGSDPSGNDRDVRDGSYITARMNGKPWQAVYASFLVEPTDDTVSPGSALVGIGLNQVSFTIILATDRPDSAALENISGKNIGEFTQDGNTFFTHSGYIKINRVSGSQVEGTFACEMIATDDSADPKKPMHVTDGKFLANLLFLPSRGSLGQ